MSKNNLVYKIINNSFKNDKLVHAYIFDGEIESDKINVSKYFAKLLLCNAKNVPCNECVDCKQVDNDSHINVNYIYSSNEVIKKKQIDELIKEAQNKNISGGVTIYIISDAANLNKSSQNALLKFLEEPFPGHYILLLTSNTNALLDTIKSRCHILKFETERQTVNYEELTKKGYKVFDIFMLEQIYNDLDKVKTLLEDSNIIENNKLFYKLYEGICKNKIYNEYLLNLNKLTLLYNKDGIIYFIEFMKILLKLSIQKTGKVEIEKINDNIKSINKDVAILIFDILDKYKTEMLEYLNIPLQIEAMILEIQEVLCKK